MTKPRFQKAAEYFAQKKGTTPEALLRQIAEARPTVEGPIDYVLMDRMERFFGGETDPWGVEFDRELLEDPDLVPLATPYAEAIRMGQKETWTAEMHAARILFIINSPADLDNPIEIDCRCNRGFVYADPEIIDGWHRYLAHRFLGSERIPISFSGRVDLVEFLRGDTDECPEE